MIQPKRFSKAAFAATVCAAVLFFSSCSKDDDSPSAPSTSGLPGSQSQMGVTGNSFAVDFAEDPQGIDIVDISVVSMNGAQSNVRMIGAVDNPFMAEIADVMAQRYPDFMSVNGDEIEVNLGLKFTENGIALLGPGERSSEGEEQVLVRYDAEVGDTFSSSHSGKVQIQQVTEKWVEDDVRYVTMETIQHDVPSLESMVTTYSEAQGLVSGIAVFDNGEIIEFGVASKYPNGPVMTDSRDGNTYRTIRIGSQTWMAENLKYLPSVNEVTTVSNEVPYHYVYGYSGIDVEEAKASENYGVYGVLYNWEAAKNACPAGWRTATDEDWTVLTDHLGGEEVAGRKLKEAGSDHWSFFNISNADNESGFTALPGGSNWEAEFVARGNTAYFWTGTENAQNQSHAWRRGMSAMTESVNRTDNGKRYGMSVRCIKN